MKYLVVANTNKGISRAVNQDSILLKHTKIYKKEVILAIVCDGVGGLSRGEIASNYVIDEFEKWFNTELKKQLKTLDLNKIAFQWSILLNRINTELYNFGQNLNIKLGTTFTGMLIIDNEYVVGHIGDTRLYWIYEEAIQLTKDHTLVEREVEKGTLTIEEAQMDKRRNILLQCIGSNSSMEPQIFLDSIKEGTYLICSDGFRHKITSDEMVNMLQIERVNNKKNINHTINAMINLNMVRKEKDNISAILVTKKTRRSSG